MNLTKFVIILNNAIKANKYELIIISSKKIIPLLEVLVRENFICGYKKLSTRKIIVFLKKNYHQNNIRILKKIGKPNFPVYISYHNIWPFWKSLNTLILSTSRGILTHREALKYSCGGVVICALF
jgi:small subunit ribosomal protein S8